MSGVNVPEKSVVLKSYPIDTKQTVDYVRSITDPLTHVLVGVVGYRARETYILLAVVVTPAAQTVSSSRKPTKASCVIAVI